MRRVHKFVADDGAEFLTETDCRSHEDLLAEIAAVMATLPNRPDDEGLEFSNGHGYLQHTAENFWLARDALLRIGSRIVPHQWVTQSLEDRTIHPSWCGRLFSEACAPLYRAWQRISCVDSQLREWGQPYFANHPEDVRPENNFELRPGKRT